MTQDQLAERVGVDRTAVSNWERGRHFPQRYLGRVEDILGIRLDGPEPEPDVPESLKRQVAALTPRQRRWMRAWLSEEIRREDGGHPPQAAQA